MSFSLPMVRLLGVTVIAGAGLVYPALASAQVYPSYAQPQYQSGEETIHGRIVAINDIWHITVYDDRGFNDTIELHQGTIINPTGLTLGVGMRVTILGYANGAVFEANEIDTPYQYYGAPIVPVYYGPGWWCPGYRYGYGPSVSLVFIFERIEIRRFNHDRPFWGFGDERDRIIGRWTPWIAPHRVRGSVHAYTAPTYVRRVDTTPVSAPRTTRDSGMRTDAHAYSAPTYVRRVDGPSTSTTRTTRHGGSSSAGSSSGSGSSSRGSSSSGSSSGGSSSPGSHGYGGGYRHV